MEKTELRLTGLFWLWYLGGHEGNQPRGQRWAEQSRAEQSRAEQSRAEQSRAEQSRAEQSIPRYRSPLIRPGGKFRQAGLLVELIAKIPHTCYVEPFCGAAHVLFRKPVSKIEVINDADGELVNFFRCAQTVPEAVARAVAAMPHSRKLHSLLKRAPLELFDPIQRAARFAWLVHRSFGGHPDKGFAYARVGPGGGLTTTAGIFERLRNLVGRLDRVTLECLDWRECLEKYDAPTTLFYLDPPYIGTDAGYEHDLTERDHRDLAAAIRHLQGRWILTVGDSPLMRELYKGYPVRQISTAQSLKKEKRGRFGELVVLDK